jgi:peptidoglycan/xylan/chitin deacetylase (PgdA/CDA1 family)
MPHVKHVYPVRTLKAFKEDLEFLLRHYRPVGLEGLLSGYLGNNSRPAMFLSFDDGLSEVYDLVVPVLIAKGIPAAVFVNTDFLDNRNLFYRYKISLLLDRFEKTGYPSAVTERLKVQYDLAGSGKGHVREFISDITYDNRQELDRIAELIDLDFNTFLRIKKPYMSLVQLRDLAMQGFYIGAHSSDHPPFMEIDTTERIRQYRESMEFVQKEMNLDYGIFSFPFSDQGIPGDFFRDIKAKGMPRLEASFGTAGLKKDPVLFHFHRIQMETRKAPASRLIRGEYLYYMAKGLVGRNMIRRK